MFPKYLYLAGYWLCLHKHHSCELWFVGCRERRETLLGPPEQISLRCCGSSMHSPWLGPTQRAVEVRAVRNAWHWGNGQREASLHLIQWKQAIYPSMAVVAYNHALPANEACSGQQGESGAACQLKQFAGEGSELVCSLACTEQQTNWKGSLPVSVFDALE